MTARGNLQRLMPKEVRIVKYLRTIKDPERLLSVLNDTVTPGDEFEGKEFDNLYTYVSLHISLSNVIINLYFWTMIVM